MIEIIIYFLVIGALMASVRAGVESQGLTNKNYLSPSNTKVIKKRIEKKIINNKKTIKKLEEQTKKIEKPIIEIPIQEIKDLSETIKIEPEKTIKIKTLPKNTQTVLPSKNVQAPSPSVIPLPVITQEPITQDSPLDISQKINDITEKINPTTELIQNEPEITKKLQEVNNELEKNTDEQKNIKEEPDEEIKRDKFKEWAKKQKKERKKDKKIKRKIELIKSLIDKSSIPDKKEQLKLLKTAEETIEKLSEYENQLIDYVEKDLEEKQKIIDKMKKLCNQLDDGYKKKWLEYLNNLKPNLSIKQLEQINKKLEQTQKESKLKNKTKTQDDYLREYSDVLGIEINNQTRDELITIKNRLQTLNNSINVNLIKYPVINNTVNKANKKIREINNKLSSMPGPKKITPEEEQKKKEEFNTLIEKIKKHGYEKPEKRTTNDLIKLNNMINTLSDMKSLFTLMQPEYDFVDKLEKIKEQIKLIITQRQSYESSIMSFINTEWEKIRLGNDAQINEGDIKFDYNYTNFSSGSISGPIITKYNFTIPFTRDIQSIKEGIITHLKILFTSKMNYLTDKTEKIIKKDKRDWEIVFNEIKEQSNKKA